MTTVTADLAVNTFELGPTIRYGEGAAAFAGAELAARGVTHALAVTDRGVLDAGVCAPVLRSLEAAAVRASLFADIATNPVDADAMAAVAAYLAAGCDGIVAIGGGSTLDVAKSAAAVIGNGGHIRDYEDGARPATGGHPPLVVLPTTAGTGSESVSGAFIVHSERRVKMHIVAVAADVALCDPLLTLDLPPAATAATGLDALSHAIGAFAGIDHQPVTDGLALHAIEKISGSLAAAVTDGHDRDARGEMMVGSLTAGLAMKGGGTGEHAFAHAVNALYNVHHGVGCAMFLAEVMAFNVPHCADRYARIAMALGVESFGKPELDVAWAGVAAVRDLVARCGIPPFGDLPITPEDLPVIARKVLEDQFSLTLNPVPIGPGDVERILWNCYEMR